jgi:Tat protein secretion system quality control protein TatD with DNase activity
VLFAEEIARCAGEERPAPGGPAQAARPPAPGAGEIEACHDAQAAVFRRWLDLAGELGLPLVVHEREAHSAARKILDGGPLPPGRVMFHCFGGTPSEAADAALAGYRISIPSSAIGRDGFREVIARVGPESLLVETDTPYQSPMPALWKLAGQQAAAAAEGRGLSGDALEKSIAAERPRLMASLVERDLPGLTFEGRGPDAARAGVPAVQHLRRSDARSRNEPAFVRLALRAIAEVRGIDLVQVTALVTASSRVLFGL